MSATRRWVAGRPFRTDRRAVSGVVAAALGVVLISILLTMVVTFWVPAWGYDNEVAHSREVINSFGEFKGSIEARAAQGATNQTVTTSVVLGVGAVPLFGAETPGSLSFRFLEGNTTRFEARLTDESGVVNLSAAGALRYDILNRYFDRQSFSYETGALVLDQADGSTVRMQPAFSFVNSTGGVTVSASLITLEGEAKSLQGIEPHTIASRLSVAHSQVFTWPGGTTLTFDIWTWYPEAWSHYFNQTAASSALPDDGWSVSTGGVQAPWHVVFAVEGVVQLTTTSALVHIVLD